MVQTNIDEGFKEIKEILSETSSDPVTQQMHTEYAERELFKILTLRIFNPSKSRNDIQKLIDQVLEDGLRATILSTKSKFFSGG